MSFYSEGKWWASPFNEAEEVLRQIEAPKAVKIHDATLRDGEQTPGVVFDINDKIKIAERLSEIGVERIEAGMPAVSETDQKAIEAIAKRNLKSEIFTFARAMRSDIDMASDLGAKGVVIEVPIGYPKLEYQFHWTWEKVVEKSADTIQYAKEKGLYAVYFPYDTTRARIEDLENVMHALMQFAPPSSVGVVDTMGCALPETIRFLVRKMKKLTNELPIEVHTHNDFGMAVATELAGIAAGADCVHSCINGLGERTGNAPLEELIVSMKILMGLSNDYNLSILPEVCEEVSRISGVPLAPNKPVSGIRNYTRESGIGVDMVLKKPLAMFATDPALYGKEGHIALGKKSGKLTIEYYLDKFDLDATEEEITEILSRVKALGQEKKRLLVDQEFLDIYDRVVRQ